MFPESGFRIATNWSKTAKMTMTSQFSDMKSSSNFSEVVVFLWSSLVIGPTFMSISLWVMTIFLYKGWTRNPEIGNTPVWVLANIWRLGWVRIPNFAQISPMKFYWILQKVTAFTVSELLRENQQGSPPTKIRVKPIVTVYRGMLKS